MRELKILIAAALLGVLGAARAQSEFDFAYNGTLSILCTNGGSPSQTCPGFPPPSNGPTIVPWTGTISFLTSSSANGTYSCRGLCTADGELSIVIDGSSWGSSWIPVFAGSSPPLPLTLTLADGAIASLGGSFTNDPSTTRYFTDGAHLSFFFDSRGGLVSISEIGNATLTPVPEPETWALLLAGIASIGALTRKRRVPL